MLKQSKCTSNVAGDSESYEGQNWGYCMTESRDCNSCRTVGPNGITKIYIDIHTLGLNVGGGGEGSAKIIKSFCLCEEIFLRGEYMETTNQNMYCEISTD